MLLDLKSYLQLLAHVLLLCVGCRVMSLIIVKLKLQMCKFRKGVLVSILYIFKYRRPHSFGDKVSNYCSPLIHWSFLEEIPIITYRNNLQIINFSKD